MLDNRTYRNLNTFGLPEAKGEPDVPITIGADDPGLFNTTLRNEFDLLGRDLIAEDVPVRAVLTWLDEARRTGLDATFIPTWAPAGQALRLHLEQFLDGHPGLEIQRQAETQEQ